MKRAAGSELSARTRHGGCIGRVDEQTKSNWPPRVDCSTVLYRSRTWPNILNLIDLPTSARVRARARMFVDIAMVEAEQASVNGLRTGQKSRAKNDDITSNFYPSVMPDLYGESTTARTNAVN